MEFRRAFDWNENDNTRFEAETQVFQLAVNLFLLLFLYYFWFLTVVLWNVLNNFSHSSDSRIKATSCSINDLTAVFYGAAPLQNCGKVRLCLAYVKETDLASTLQQHDLLTLQENDFTNDFFSCWWRINSL